jgi:hypothetical protein
MVNFFGGGDKKPEPMNSNPQMDAQCKAAVMDAAKALVGTGVKIVEVHQQARQNASEAGVSCSIGIGHVVNAVNTVKDAGKGR